MTLVTHRAGLLRNLAAAVLYAVAAAGLVAGLGLAWLAADSRARNAATGDLTGSAMADAAALAWCLPLALGAALLAMQLRSFPREEPDGGRMGPDRRLLRGLERLDRGPRRFLAVVLAGASLALATLIVYSNGLPWLATTWSDPSKITPAEMRNWALLNLIYLGPLMLLAVACGSLAWRLVRDRHGSGRP